MTLKETLEQLKALGSAKVRAQNAKGGAGDNQFGVSLGEIRVLATMTLNGEIVQALTNWQAVVAIAATLLACAGWRMLQRRFNGQLR